MTRNYRLRPAAERDLESIGDHIALDDPVRAVTFVDELKLRFQLLSEMPKMGVSRPAWRAGLRMLPAGSYLIFYTEEPKGIVIERVLHGSRDVNRLI